MAIAKASAINGFEIVFRRLRSALVGLRRGGDDVNAQQNRRRHGVPATPPGAPLSRPAPFGLETLQGAIESAEREVLEWRCCKHHGAPILGKEYEHCNQSLAVSRAREPVDARRPADPEERPGRAILTDGDDARRGEIWAIGATLEDRLYGEKWARLFRLCFGLFLIGVIIGTAVLALWQGWAR